MWPSSLARRLVLGVLAWVVPVLALGAIAAVGLAGPGGTGSWSVTGVAFGVGALAIAAGGAVWLAARPLERAVEELRLGTELMATVNADHRLAAPAIGELGGLAFEINRLAARLGDARNGLEREVARATAELLAERATLTAVLEALGEGAAVVTAEGVVTLANPEAHRLLGAPRGGLLGRTLFDFVDREKLGHFLDRLRTGGAARRFTLHPRAGSVLATVVTPFFDADRRLIGAVLVMHDVTRPARADEEARQFLADALRGLRGPLAAVRSLSESLLRAPTSTAEAARRLLAAIHTEAVRLSHLVTRMEEPARLGHGTAWHFESVAFDDLASITLRRLAQEGSPPMVEVDGSPSLSPLWVDVSALSSAMAHVLRGLLPGGRPGEARVSVRQVGRLVQVDLATDGTSPPGDLEPLLDVPLTVRAGESATVRDVLRQHAGEGWAWSEAGRMGIRIILPASGPGDDRAAAEAPFPGAALVGAGLRSGEAPGQTEPQRPDLYDFSLFEQMERAVPTVARERRLDELTGVVFDLETTGLHPEGGDRIVSIAGLRIRAGAVKRGEMFDALVHPGRPIPVASVRYHGITDATVAGALSIDAVLPAFLRFAEGGILVGHQVWFDIRFLAREAARLGLPPVTLTHPVLDTVVLSEIVHGATADHRLEAIAERLGVVVRARHSALGDALVTAEIFVRLIELLRGRGIVTLGQALHAAHALGRAQAGDITPGAGP